MDEEKQLDEISENQESVEEPTENQEKPSENGKRKPKKAKKERVVKKAKPFVYPIYVILFMCAVAISGLMVVAKPDVALLVIFGAPLLCIVLETLFNRKLGLPSIFCAYVPIFSFIVYGAMLLIFKDNIREYIFGPMAISMFMSAVRIIAEIIVSIKNKSKKKIIATCVTASALLAVILMILFMGTGTEAMH